MSDIFFDELGIRKPDHHLGINGGGQGAQTGRMLEAIEKVCLLEKPSGLLVYGDTNSTLAGGLAAAKLHIPLAHIEAGLRSYNRKMPEEINRVLTDHLAEILFAPTENAVNNLAMEGIRGERVIRTGDVMYDASLRFLSEAKQRSHILKTFGLQSKGYILATVHRAENTNNHDRLLNILSALSILSERQIVILPLHPRTRNIISKDERLSRAIKGVRVVEPLGYLDFLMLESNACLIATDSGGIQKESYFYRVPCVTLRDETEWVELVNSGWNHLAPPNSVEGILSVSRAAISSTGMDIDLYGTGNSASEIVVTLAKRW